MIERKMKSFVSAGDGYGVLGCEGLEVKGHFIRATPNDDMQRCLMAGWVPWQLYRFVLSHIEIRIGGEWLKVFPDAPAAQAAIQQALEYVDPEQVVTTSTLREIQEQTGFTPEYGGESGHE